ncbi:MAG: CDP-glucose 4,6-dehydratase [Desulfurococcaceae archaeon]
MVGVDYRSLFGGVYCDLPVLVTGHTGFKGSWLTLVLSKLGASVTGYSLPPHSAPNHFDLISRDLKINSVIGDIRDRGHFMDVVKRFQPRIIFHLAAQAYVKRSYIDPVCTYETNVMGTLNVLEATRQTESVESVVVITTDKCYENKEWLWSYREIDALGGKDPYSSSKACAEMLVRSYRESFFPLDKYKVTHNKLVATCRAGNVIGGGDWGEDRLIPDIVRAINSRDKLLHIRNPDAIRPWQHVLDVTFGYLLLGQKLLEGKKEFADAWNFSIQGPDVRVMEIVDLFKKSWENFQINITDGEKFSEHKILKLDSSKARGLLGWKPLWGISEAIRRTLEWYKAYYENGDVLSEHDLEEYVIKLGEGEVGDERA